MVVDLAAGDHFAYPDPPSPTQRYEDAIARYHIAWAKWMDEGDALQEAAQAGFNMMGYFGEYNRAQYELEHAEANLARQRYNFRHPR